MVYPNVVYTRDGIAYDEDGNVVKVDKKLVADKVQEMQAAEEAKLQAAQAKLTKLGLTPDDLKALLG